MKALKKTISAALAVSLTLSSVISASATDIKPKEEVIYIMTDANGNTQNVYAVNIYGGGSVTDYGYYSSVKILNTNDKVTVNEDIISFSSGSDRVYLQGDMANVEIPWDIVIEYILDGEPVTPDFLAGKSGRLEIRFTVSENENASGNFYENYALQASFTLDTKLCGNISTEGATVANVGSKKQITYTILPGSGIDTAITADVHDFEMDSAAINGVRLNLNINADTSGLFDNINELTDGIEELDDGAKELSDGAHELYDGAGELTDGVSELRDGADALADGTGSLNDGVSQLTDGIDEIRDGLEALCARSDDLVNGSAQVLAALQKIQSGVDAAAVDTEKLGKLTEASGKISAAISSLREGAVTLAAAADYTAYKSVMNKNGLDIDALAAGNAQTVNTLAAQMSELQATLEQIKNVPGYEEQAAQLSSQIEQLNGIVMLLKGSSGMISGTEQYFSQLSDGAEKLKAGLAQLETSYAEFNAGISELADTLSSTLVNMSALAEGIKALTAQYAQLDTGIGEYTDGVAKLYSGFDKLKSGISELANGSRELLDGANELSEGADKLYNGAGELYDGAGELVDGADRLSDGTGELRDKTSDIDDKVNDKIDDIIAEIGGSDDTIMSFVSEKNTNVETVQFVIKTQAIEKPEADTQQEEIVEHLNFWQKLLRLFGLY